MVGNADTAPHHDAVFQDRASRKSGLGGDDAIATDLHIVPHLDEIIDLALFANDCVVIGAAIHAGVGPDADSVLQNHATELGNVERAGAAACNAEPGLADHGARANRHAIADQRKADIDIGADPAIPPNGDSWTNHALRANFRAAPDLGTLADDYAGRQGHIIFQFAIRMYGGCACRVAQRSV